jgi:signal recognition particle subunit SEC65
MVEFDADGGLQEYASDTYITQHLFRNAPISAKSAELKTLLHDLDEARSELRKIRAEISSTKRESAEFLAQCAQHRALKFALNYIEDPNTLLDKPCVETSHNGFTIQTLREKLEYKDPYENARNRDKIKLLTLFGNAAGNLQWQFSSYSDGSGSMYEVEIFDTWAEAEAYVHEQVREEITDAVKNKNLYYADVLDKKYPGLATGEELKIILTARREWAGARVVKLANELADKRQEFVKAQIEFEGVSNGTNIGNNSVDAT